MGIGGLGTVGIPKKIGWNTGFTGGVALLGFFGCKLLAASLASTRRSSRYAIAKTSKAFDGMYLRSSFLDGVRELVFDCCCNEVCYCVYILKGRIIYAVAQPKETFPYLTALGNINRQGLAILWWEKKHVFEVWGHEGEDNLVDVELDSILRSQGDVSIVSVDEWVRRCRSAVDHGRDCTFKLYAQQALEVGLSAKDKILVKEKMLLS
jgi:hypothetical protein